MRLTLDNRTKCGCSTVFSWEFWKRHLWELRHANHRIRFSISALVRVRVDYNEQIGMFECFVAELYDWMMTPAQEEELRALMATEGEDYRWATLQEIEAFGVIPKQQASASIANSAVWLLHP
jgi:hypothetical protein